MTIDTGTSSVSRPSADGRPIASEQAQRMRWRALRSRAIPSSMEASRRKAGYRGHAIDHDCEASREPCVDVRSFGIAGVNFYSNPYNPPYFERPPGAIETLPIRTSVGLRLAGVDAALSAVGLRLFVLDAWRPQAIQQYFYDIWFPRWLTERRPKLAGAELQLEVEKYWSRPTESPDSPSPHSTGAAVDLTLQTAAGEALYMGGIFDDLTENAWTDAFEGAEPTSMSAEEARANRRILYWAMSDAGFANNPTEWWHYSLGDQMWARLQGHPAACYGATEPTEL